MLYRSGGGGGDGGGGGGGGGCDGKSLRPAKDISSQTCTCMWSKSHWKTYSSKCRKRYLEDSGLERLREVHC